MLQCLTAEQHDCFGYLESISNNKEAKFLVRFFRPAHSNLA